MKKQLTIFTQQEVESKSYSVPHGFDIFSDTSFLNYYSGSLVRFTAEHKLRQYTEQYKNCITNSYLEAASDNKNSFKYNVSIPKESIGIFLGADDWYRVVVGTDGRLIHKVIATTFIKFLIGNNIVVWKSDLVRFIKVNSLEFQFVDGTCLSYDNMFNCYKGLESASVLPTSDPTFLTRTGITKEELFVKFLGAHTLMSTEKELLTDIDFFCKVMSKFGFLIQPANEDLLL